MRIVQQSIRAKPSPGYYWNKPLLLLSASVGGARRGTQGRHDSGRFGARGSRGGGGRRRIGGGDRGRPGGRGRGSTVGRLILHDNAAHDGGDYDQGTEQERFRVHEGPS